MAQHQHVHVGGGDAQALHRRVIVKIRVVSALARHTGKQPLKVRRSQCALRQREHELAGQVGHHLHRAVGVCQRVRAENCQAVGFDLRVDARRAEIIVERHVQLSRFHQRNDRVQLLFQLFVAQALDDVTQLQPEARAEVELIARHIAVGNRGRRQLARRIVALRQRCGGRQQHRGAQAESRHFVF